MEAKSGLISSTTSPAITQTHATRMDTPLFLILMATLILTITILPVGVIRTDRLEVV